MLPQNIAKILTKYYVSIDVLQTMGPAMLAKAMQAMEGAPEIQSLPMITTTMAVVVRPQPVLEECFKLDTCPMGQDMPSLFATS